MANYNSWELFSLDLLTSEIYKILEIKEDNYNMFYNNPFSGITDLVSPLAIQGFTILMVGLVALGTLMDIIHKKNVKYFFDNAKKAKKNAKVELSTSQRTSVILKTVAHDIATTAE